MGIIDTSLIRVRISGSVGVKVGDSVTVRIRVNVSGRSGSGLGSHPWP